jgi:hypothetical protein
VLNDSLVRVSRNGPHPALRQSQRHWDAPCADSRPHARTLLICLGFTYQLRPQQQADLSPNAVSCHSDQVPWQQGTCFAATLIPGKEMLKTMNNSADEVTQLRRATAPFTPHLRVARGEDEAYLLWVGDRVEEREKKKLRQHKAAVSKPVTPKGGGGGRSRFGATRTYKSQAEASSSPLLSTGFGWLLL